MKNTSNRLVPFEEEKSFYFQHEFPRDIPCDWIEIMFFFK